jgi:hypothetical protein
VGGRFDRTGLDEFFRPHRATATWDADLFEAVGDGEKIRKEVMKKA